MDINGNYIQSQFCSYEIALKLKELGFDEECIGWYNLNILCKFGYWKQDKNIFCNSELHTGYIAAPLWQQVWSFLDDNGVIISIIFVDNVFKYTLNIENYVSNEFKDRMSVIKSATEHATNYLWDKKFNK